MAKRRPSATEGTGIIAGGWQQSGGTRRRGRTMRTTGDLRRILRRIDGKGYKAYKEIEGAYDCGEHTLFLDHAQGDPFASPSLARVRVPQKVALLPRDTYSNKIREIALRDFLTRKFFDASRRFCKGDRGTGNSGVISIDRPRQETSSTLLARRPDILFGS